MSTEVFLRQIDEIHTEYEKSDKGHWETDSFKEELLPLVLAYKGGE